MDTDNKCVTITIASANQDKVNEIKEILNLKGLCWQNLTEAGFEGEILEDGDTYQANALIKARTVHAAVGGWVLADDSGLSVDLLDGAPGIYSARFAGEEAAYTDKIAYLYKMLAEWPPQDWTAAFVCAVALISPQGREWVLEAKTKGMIAAKARGDNGFGYDPIFYLPAFNSTMAELTPSQKHAISHRGKALQALLSIIEKENLFHV